VKADSKKGKSFERSITLLSDVSLIPNDSPNLLANSSFEDKSAAGNSPEAWNVDGKTVSWDEKEASSGSRSLRFEMQKPFGSFYIMDNIPVESEGVYNLSLMAKGANVQKMSYAIFPGMSDAHILRFPDGTYNWTRINSQFRIKPGITKIGLCIANAISEKRDEGSGVLWIDDVSIRRVK
jgi:hypothetical protein